MLQRAFYLLHGAGSGRAVSPDRRADDRAATSGRGSRVRQLLEGLFGPVRQLYKRLAQYSYFEQQELYQRLARRPYPWLVACGGNLPAASTALGRMVAPHQILFDAPPLEREVEIKIDVYYPKQRLVSAAGRGFAGRADAGRDAV